MERLFDIGDIVYSKKEGIKHQYEVVDVYPLETGENYFVLKRIIDSEFKMLYPKNKEKGKFYAIEYFKQIYWFVERKVIFEKCLLEQKY